MMNEIDFAATEQAVKTSTATVEIGNAATDTKTDTKGVKMGSGGVVADYA